MDHTEAVRLQAAEKYLSGELTKAELEAYEEHYFDCPACAQELKTTVAFTESTRQVFREQAASQAAEEKGLIRGKGAWLSWLRPAFAIPVFAVLLLLIGYQNGVTIPSLKQASAHPTTVEAVRYFSLLSAGARGGESSSSVFRVGPHEDFSLDVDMPGNSPTGYHCQVQNESGRVQFTVSVSAEQAKNTVRVNVPSGSLQPGKYNFVIFSGPASSTQADLGNPAAKLPFAVEFLP
jgi:hypothetical protein